MYRFSIIIYLTLLTFAWSCKDTNSSDSQETEMAATDSLAVSTTSKEAVKLYAWVDKLRLRERPETKSKVLAELKEGEELYYLNEKTDFTERINLRGQVFDEPWLKVRTANQKEGWIYGGGVKFYKLDIDEHPSPYENCIRLFNDRKHKAAATCFARTQKTQLKKDQQYVTQSKEGITFRLLSGKEKQLLHEMDEAVEGPAHTYDYRYYIPQMGYFVVQKHTLDKGTYVLVNDKSGKEIDLWGYPKAAPDFKHLLSYHGDLESGFEANGLQLFGFTDRGLEKLWEQELTDYEPVSVRWLNQSTAEIDLRPPTYNTDLRPKIVLLKAGPNGWQLE